MPMYALATIPLIRKLKNSLNDVNQIWYADDAAGAGKVKTLHEWWDQNVKNMATSPTQAKRGSSSRKTASQEQQQLLLILM